jgi:energy-coupling factor transporter ATP-binding protein EcfA2
MLGYDPDEVIARGKQALEQVGMLDLKNFYLGSMTRSESALLGLASVLSIDPQIIIADEPTKGLDVNSSAILIKALTDLCKSGGSVVFITHDMELAALHATRVVVMADGKIILEGDPHSVFSEVETLGRAKILPPQVTRFALGTERWKKNPPLTIEEFLHSVNNKGMEK